MATCRLTPRCIVDLKEFQQTSSFRLLVDGFATCRRIKEATATVHRMLVVVNLVTILALFSCHPELTGTLESSLGPSLTADQFADHLYIYGGRNSDTFLGCITCSPYDSDSVYNPYGAHGSPYASDSIFNDFGQFGSEFSSYSACNQYASDPPIVVDDRGQFFGYLTVNEYKVNRVLYRSLIALVIVACNK